MKKKFFGFLAFFFVLTLTNCKKDVSVTSITVNPTTATLDIGKTLQLNYVITPKDAVEQTVTWSSDNTTVASVNVNGLVTSFSAGTAKITATTKDGGYTASCAVTVVPDPVSVTGITVNPSTATLILNKTLQLNYVITPSNADVQTVTWSSDNTSVATVSSSGLITAISEGKAEITVTTNDGSYTASCTITVQIDIDWLTNYNIVKDGPNWGAERIAFEDAFNQYKAVYGIIDYANPSISEELLVTATFGQFAAALMITDVNYRKEVMAQLPVNFLYYMQKNAIKEYVDVVKAILANDDTRRDAAKAEIIDLFGGITFNPLSLSNLVLGTGMTPNFRILTNMILDFAITFDAVSLCNATLPGYDVATKNYLGATIYGQGPILQRWNKVLWEENAWFLIFILLENSPNIPLFMGGTPYVEADTRMCDVFLGTHAADYPFCYDYTLASPASDATLAPNHRFFLMDRLDFNSSADVNSLPSSSVLWSLLAAENNLRLKWHDWGTTLKNLNDIEETLYAPNHKIWNAANHTWPSVPVSGIAPLWITELPSGSEAVGIPK